MIYGYIRVSHDRQAASGLGLAAQKKKIEEHAKTIPGPKLARIFRDAAVSASKNRSSRGRRGGSSIRRWPKGIT